MNRRTFLKGLGIMSVAARVAGWDRRKGKWASLPMSPHGGAGTVGGVPFCPDEFGAGSYLRVRIAFGAVLSNPSSSWTFTDVTSDVLQNDGNYINIQEIGLPNESVQVPPASCQLRLNNIQNLYSKNNPLCPNWPNVRNNTPLVIDVTFDGGANWGTLFWGEISTWQPSWDVTGNYAVTDVQVYGRTQRADNHSQPLKSALTRAVIAGTPTPLIYYPMEDGANSTQAASGISGPPMTFETPYPAWADKGPGGSAPLPDFFGDGTDDRFGNKVIVTGAQTDDYWAVQSVAAFGASTGGDWAWLEWTSTGTWPKFWAFLNSGDGSISLFTTVGGIATEITFDNSRNYRDDVFRQWTFTATKSGSNVVFAISINGVQTASAILAGTMKRISVINVGRLGAMSGSSHWGHVQVYDSTFPDYTDAMNGYTGEPPGNRMIRLCDEEGVGFQIVGTYSTETALGPQAVDTFMNIMREASDSDDGFLYDGLSAGIQYQGISQRYNQATALTIDATQHEMTPDFKPIDDDLRAINKVTVNNKNGSSAVAEKTDGLLGTGPDGIGIVDAQVSVNFDGDSRLPFRASWEVWKGTIEGFRYPIIPLNLRAHPSVARNWLNRSDGTGPVIPGSRLDIENISSWATQHPPGIVSLVMEGWAMRLTNLMWETDIVCTSNHKYDVFQVEDSQFGAVETSGSVITIDAPVGATSVTFMATGTTGWTVDSGDFPMYLEIDGIKVTATAGSGSGLNFQYTVDPATVTKPLLVGVAVTMWDTGVISY